MGHITNPNKDYRLLQKRFDNFVTGAPDSPTLQKILQIIYKPDEVRIARKLPGTPASLSSLSEKLGIPQDELQQKLTTMARRGVVLDLALNNEHYYFLPPLAMGFYEFIFMRTRDDLPLKELAELFETYMREDDNLFRSVWQKQTQVGRALVHEEHLPESDHAEVLDYERASHLVASATTVGVSLCACRHHAGHLDKACDAPMEACLTLNRAAEILIGSGNARRISNEEGLEILKKCKEHGLVQTGDNVQQDLSYICSCCSCCCGMMDAINSCDISTVIHTSNWLLAIENDKCKGCGLCVAKCPVNALEMKTGEDNRKLAVCTEDKCLGCGVCPASCRFDAMKMVPRKKRVFTPETVIDKTIAMALERGKLTEMIFEDPEKVSHKVLARLLKALENSPPHKAAMAIKPLKSVFLNTLVKQAKKKQADFL